MIMAKIKLALLLLILLAVLSACIGDVPGPGDFAADPVTIPAPEEPAADPEPTLRDAIDWDALSPTEAILTAFNLENTQAEGELTASVDGDTITISGSVTGASEGLVLPIPHDVTVIWKAELEGHTRGALIHVHSPATSGAGALGGFALAPGSRVVNTLGDGISLGRQIDFSAEGATIETEGVAISVTLTNRSIALHGSTVRSASTAILADNAAVFIHDNTIVESSGAGAIHVTGLGGFVRIHSGHVRGTGEQTSALVLAGSRHQGDVARVSGEAVLVGAVPYGRVIIDPDAKLIIPEGEALTLGDHVILNINRRGGLINHGRIDSPGEIANDPDGTVNNTGEINNLGGLITNLGSIANSGSILNQGEINNLGALESTGRLDNTQGSIFTIWGGITGAPVTGTPVEEDMHPDEIAQLLTGIPHPGMRISFAIREGIAGLDQRGLEIAAFVSGINGWWGPPRESFSSPEYAPFNFVFWAAFMRTSSLQWYSSDENHYHPELSVLAPSITAQARLNDRVVAVTLGEHIEDTSEALFGRRIAMREDFEGGIIGSAEFSGVYVYLLGTFGVGPVPVPYMLSYEEIDGGYQVTVVWADSEDFLDPENNWEPIPEDEQLEILRAIPDRHIITLLRNEAGGFYYHAHVLPEGWGED